MTELTKLPVTVITGFLGSGKTTLIRHLMQNAGGKRLAVVVNEFGDVGVDGEILKGCSIPDCPEENIIELANGCICCTVADDFIPTIEALMKLDPKPEHILIETSGLALPKPLLKAFDWPDIRSKITVDGVIALADTEAVAGGRFAPNVDAVRTQQEADDSLGHETPISEVFEDQMACADIILLTKTDLASPDAVVAAKSVITKETPRPLPIVEVAEGVVDPRVILGLDAAAEDDLLARPSHHDEAHHHDHEDFDSVIVNLDEVDNPDTLSKKIKGYAAVKGKPMRLLVQAVGSRVRAQYDRPWREEEKRLGRLVVIGEHDDISHDCLEAVLKG